MELDEYFITKSFQSVTESLSLFKDDPLVHSPGKEFFENIVHVKHHAGIYITVKAKYSGP